jgi:hypothetical protein
VQISQKTSSIVVLHGEFIRQLTFEKFAQPAADRGGTSDPFVQVDGRHSQKSARYSIYHLK